LAPILDVLKDDPTDVLRRINSDIDHSMQYRKFHADRWYRYYRKYRGYHDDEFLKFRGDKYSIFVPLIFSLIENLVPRFVLGTFGSYPFINVAPVGPEDIEPSKLAERLLNTQLSNDNIILKAPGWLKQFCMYGTSPAKVIWKQKKATLPLGKSSREVVTYLGPSFEPMDLFDLLVDPKATDVGVDSAGYLIHTVVIGEEDMKYRVAEMKKYGYKFPPDWENEFCSSENEMGDKILRARSIGLTERESPDRKYWRFDEYWTPKALITVLNRRHIIRRSVNAILDYPFININRNAMIGDFYGIGDIESVESLTDEVNYLRNLRLDNLDILTNGMFLVERAAQVNKDELVARAGKTIDTNDINGVKQLVFQDVTEPSRREEGLIKQEIQEVGGLIDMMKGSLDRSNVPAAGMAMLMESASYRIKLGLLMVEHYGIRQIGEKFMRLNYLNMPGNYITRQVGKSDWLKLKGPEEIFGNFDYIPSGSSEFLNKETLKNSIIQLYNLLSRDPSVDQVGLKRLLAMAFGGRLVETILLGKQGEGQKELPPGQTDQAQGGDESGQIQQENNQMLDGQEIPPVGNHEQHIQGHAAIMQAPEFAQLNSGIQGIFGRHVEGHKRAMSMGGAPLESPDRMAQEMGKGLEEGMKSSLQQPIAG
jgi:hypothetical protein